MKIVASYVPTQPVSVLYFTPERICENRPMYYTFSVRSHQNMIKRLITIDLDDNAYINFVICENRILELCYVAVGNNPLRLSYLLKLVEEEQSFEELVKEAVMFLLTDSLFSLPKLEQVKRIDLVKKLIQFLNHDTLLISKIVWHYNFGRNIEVLIELDIFNNNIRINSLDGKGAKSLITPDYFVIYQNAVYNFLKG